MEGNCPNPTLPLTPFKSREQNSRELFLVSDPPPPLLGHFPSIWTFQSQKRLYIHKCPFVHPSVSLSGSKTLQQLKSFIFHHPTFIFHHSSFILHSSFIPSSFFIHPSFISRLLSFSACWFTHTSFNLEI